MLWVAYAARRPSQAILEALGGLYMQDCRYELRRIPLPRTSVNSAVGPTRQAPTGGIIVHQDRRRPERSARGRGRLEDTCGLRTGRGKSISEAARDSAHENGDRHQ